MTSIGATFGEEIGIMSDELLQRLVEEQALESVKVYGKNSGAADANVLSLRVDFQSKLFSRCPFDQYLR
jgi:hypothetical protein